MANGFGRTECYTRSRPHRTSRNVLYGCVAESAIIPRASSCSGSASTIGVMTPPCLPNLCAQPCSYVDPKIPARSLLSNAHRPGRLSRPGRTSPSGPTHICNSIWCRRAANTCPRRTNYTGVQTNHLLGQTIGVDPHSFISPTR